MQIHIGPSKRTTKSRPVFTLKLKLMQLKIKNKWIFTENVMNFNMKQLVAFLVHYIFVICRPPQVINFVNFVYNEL